MINFIVLQGHLTADPVYRAGESGKSSSIWGKIGVYQGKDQQGNDLPSLFVEFTAFGKEADTLAQFAHKGDLIVASGRFSETTSQGNDGTVYTNKKIVGNAKMCYKLPSQNQGQPMANNQNFNQQMNQALNTMGMGQPVQQYQAQPMINQGYAQQTMPTNQSMWG